MPDLHISRSPVSFTPTIELAGEGGNAFAVLSIARRNLRSRLYPQHLIETMERRALAAPSYAELLAVVHEYTGAKFTLHGRDFDHRGWK